MSNQQFFSGGDSPIIPNVEFIQGTTGGPVGPDPTTHVMDFTSEDLGIDGDPGTYTQHFVDLVKWTPYVVDGHAITSIIDFDIDFVTLNSIVATIDGVPEAPVVFNTDQATTISDLAVQIASNSSVVSANVTGAQQITVVFISGVHTVNSVVTTLGATQPTATITENTPTVKSAPYVSIQDALDAADAAGGKLVLVRYGTGDYVEDLTLYDGITILGVQPVGSTSRVKITGTHTPPNSGEIGFSNLNLVDATAVLSSAAAGTTNIFFKDCLFAVTNGFVADLTAWTGNITFSDCEGAGVDDGIVNNATGTSVISIVNSQLGGGGQVLTTGGNVLSRASVINCPSSFLGACVVDFKDTYSAALTFNSTSSGTIVGGKASSSSSAITQSSSGTISLANLVIDSSVVGYAIGGAGVGVITLANLVFIDNEDIDPALTTAVYDWKPYATQGTSVTATKGTAAFDEDHFTVTDGFVTLADVYAGTGQTIGAVTDDILSIDLGGVAGTLQIEARVKAFESSTPASAGYNITATFRTDGASATLVGDQPVFNEDPALEDANAYFVASGNNAVLQVLGVAALTINWTGEAEVT